MTVNELERMWKEATCTVSNLRYYPGIKPVGAEEKHENFSHDKDSDGHLPTATYSCHLLKYVRHTTITYSCTLENKLSLLSLYGLYTD
jgi:hypothetical protein